MPPIPDDATFGLHQACPTIRPHCASSRRHAGGRQPARPSLRSGHNRRRTALRITTTGNPARAAGSRRCSWRTVATRCVRTEIHPTRRIIGPSFPRSAAASGHPLPRRVLYPRLRHAGRKFFIADFWPGPDLLPCALSGRSSGSAHRRRHLQRKSLGNGSFSSIGNRGKSGPKHPFRRLFRASGRGSLCTYGTPVPSLPSACAMIIPASAGPALRRSCITKAETFTGCPDVVLHDGNFVVVGNS